MYKVDLNSDLGESFGAYTIGLDNEVIAHVSSVNVACGYHAGDPLVMEKTVAAAKAAGVAVGAHPGFPDLMGFGRRNMVVSPKEVKAYVKYQLGALMAFAAAEGIRLQHCKPHGALYNMAGKDMDLALAIAEAIAEVDKDIILLGLANSKMIDAGKQLGLRVANEVFADRAYQADFPNELIQWQTARLCRASCPAPSSTIRTRPSRAPSAWSPRARSRPSPARRSKSRLTPSVSTVTILRPSNSSKISARSSPPAAWRSLPSARSYKKSIVSICSVPQRPTPQICRTAAIFQEDDHE